MDEKVIGIGIGANIRKRETILRGWDEICEKLTLGQTVDLNTFVPDEQRAQKKNAAISKLLEDKQKL